MVNQVQAQVDFSSFWGLGSEVTRAAWLYKGQQIEITSRYFDSECLVNNFPVATTTDVILGVSVTILESKNYKAAVILSLCTIQNKWKANISRFE